MSTEHVQQPYSVAGAVRAVNSGTMDGLVEAREFAENLGYAAFQSKELMPKDFANVPVLAEGFEEGLANAKCEYEQVRAGLL